MRPVKEIWHTAISPNCLPATLLLAGTMVYWIASLVGIVGEDLITEGNDSDSSSTNGHGLFHEIASVTLGLLNSRGIPFMLVMTIVSIYLWGGMIFGTMHLPEKTPFYSLILSGGSVTLAVFLTSITAIPLKPLFAKLQLEDEPALPIVGRVGTVRSNEITTSFGQVEIPDRHGPMLIHARLSPDQKPLAKNSQVLIISIDQEKLVYTVIPTESL